MKTPTFPPAENPDNRSLSAVELLAQVEELQQQLQHRECYIALLEELLRLKKAQQFAASSERHTDQIALFDEAELDVAMESLLAQLPDDVSPPPPPSGTQKRQRGFSDSLLRERVELCLSDEEKAGARTTFFSKVKEELAFIPAQLKVIEYWQEKAVFDRDGEEFIVAARRPVHPLGKCFATTALLAYIIVAKYADGLPLYRLENMLARSGHPVGRTNMAHWIIRLAKVFAPLLARLRDVQNSGRYLQMDESRIQVLKEEGKTAQSDKWMWVIRGGPPDKPSVLFEYDPSRAGSVPVRLLAGFTGILQTDGYAGYDAVCRENNLVRIGCWDHARRKYIEAGKAVPKGAKSAKGKPTKADVALGYIGKLYGIERSLQGRSEADKYLARQQYSLPLLKAFKLWLEQNVGKIMKGSLTRQAMDYTLNHWAELIGYCDHGQVNISNALAENAIRPFAVGRKAWLFADSSQGASASAGCYSLIETAKANQLEPTAYIQYVLDHIGEADTQEKLDALLPWNVDLVPFLKNVSQYG
ncbi:IS66 family transposase [Brenneria uluponensis]|uniref:IS66 family transposase n=1 Tax=Brenneria uluponensis TaxID=3057057 RepID=UPI0028ECB165|nr:IS66 family transposase [Brenneria ulupoensis]